MQAECLFILPERNDVLLFQLQPHVSMIRVWNVSGEQLAAEKMEALAGMDGMNPIDSMKRHLRDQHLC